MRKGVKIVGMLLSAAVLLLMVLPVSLSILLDISAVQNYVVQVAARVVSQRLGTTVSIDRVQIGLFPRVRVYGFYVEDLQRDTLFYVGRLDARFSTLGLLGGGLELSHGEIADAKLYLRETPGGEMNIKQVVARMSDPNRERKGNFRLMLRKATIENMDLCLERQRRRDPPFGIDYGHMHLYGINARVEDFTVDGQIIHAAVSGLSARERSGFVLDRFDGRFYLTNGCLGFQDVRIVTGRSDVTIPHISLVGDSWLEYRDFLGSVRLEGRLRRTILSSDDVAYFAPALRDWHLTFSDVDLEVAGKVADFAGRVYGMRIGEGTWLEADAEVRGLPDVKTTHFDLRIPHLISSAPAVDILSSSVARRELSDRLVEVLSRTGRVDLTARFEGLLSSFDVQAAATTDVGEVDCRLRLRPLPGGLRSVRGDVAARSLQLGKLLDRRDLFDRASVTARVDGSVGRGQTDANIVGNVTQLGFNGYVYDSLRLDGRLRNREFDGRIASRDPNLDFDFLGMVDFNDSIPLYDFTMELRHADLARLHVNRRDSVSQLSARIVAKAGGRSLDDLNGRIQVTDAVYRYNDKQLEARNVTVTGENSASSKLVELRSDFADATFRSKTSYRVVFDYLRQSAWRYLPMLRDSAATTGPARRKAAVADDFSLLSVNIRNFNPVADAVAAGLQIADGSSMQLLFNPASDQLSFRASSDYVERRRMLATRLTVNASNQGDSLTLYASAEDLYAGQLHLPHLSLTGGARQGRVEVSTGFTDTVRRVSGLIGLHAEVDDEPGPNGRVMDLRIRPSHVTRGDKTWQIFARKIQIDTSRVVIDRFFVLNQDQELFLDGVASRSRADSLTLRLRNFDLTPFTQLADRLGYAIEGRSSGSASMKSVLRAGEVTADIAIDSLEVNGLAAPPLRLTSRWDFARNRAGVTIADRTTGDMLVRGFYAPAQMRYYARLNVDSLDMALLDPLLSGVISSTGGHASADLVLQGQGRDADLTGEIRIADLCTTVDYTQVTYRAPSAVMRVKNNLFSISDVTIVDPQGNRGRMDLDLDLRHLSNIGYDLRVAPEQMLVLDTDDEDNDYFYGRVYATGTARISGDKGSVRMDIAAATDDNSSFYMPMSNRSNISYADFVTFRQPERVDSLDNVMRKKMLFERKRRQRTADGSQMAISLALNVRPNVEVELMVAGNAVRARGEGMLNLQINPRSNVFEMYGDYTISEGNYNFSLQNIINKRFVIENGSTIQWTGSPTDAVLDIDAVYKLKASLQPLLQTSVGTTDGGSVGNDRSVPVECVIHLGEHLTNPSIAFDVRVPGSDPETQAVISNTLNTPETVDLQFLYLLLFNSFYAESGTGTTADLGTSASAAMSMELMSNMLSNLLSINDYNIVLRYRPRSELTSDEVDFGLSKSLINNRLLVEVEGNYLIDNKQAVNNSAMSNFMGEAYITYLIDRAGALKLRAFTQTIDRFDENQGLQETGLGIYFKEDFDNFRDFRQRIKERFTNRKRRERREARRAARALQQEQEGAPSEGDEPPDYDPMEPESEIYY